MWRRQRRCSARSCSPPSPSSTSATSMRAMPPTGNALVGARLRESRGRGRAGGRDLGGDRGRDRNLACRRARGIPRRSRPSRDRPQPDDPRRLTRCWASSPSTPRARRNRAPGPCTRARRRPKPRARSTPISSAASSAPKRSPTTIISSSAARAGARDAGKLRSEGKEYVVQDGDVMLFRFNV